MGDSQKNKPKVKHKNSPGKYIEKRKITKKNSTIDIPIYVFFLGESENSVLMFYLYLGDIYSIYRKKIGRYR